MGNSMNQPSKKYKQRIIQKNADHNFNIIMIGDSSVGKTCLSHYFLYNEILVPTMPKIDSKLGFRLGLNFGNKTIDVDEKTIKLYIWDTPGQEKFEQFNSWYYKKAHGIIFTYAINDINSFTKVKERMSEVNKYDQENIPRILVGNKKDLDKHRQVPYNKAKYFADSFEVRFLETSAKNSHNVDDAFILMTRQIKSKVETLEAQKQKQPTSNEEAPEESSASEITNDQIPGESTGEEQPLIDDDEKEDDANEAE